VIFYHFNYTKQYLTSERSQSMLSLLEACNKLVQEELTLTTERLKTQHVGKQDPRRHLEEAVERAMRNQVVPNLGTMLAEI
jgi:26S proteasome regulatory subunit N11